MWRPMVQSRAIGLHILCILFFLFSQWLFTTIGLHIFFVIFCFPKGFSPPLVSTFLFFLDSPMAFHPHWCPHFVFFVFPMVFQFPLVSTFSLFSFFVSPRVFHNHWFPMSCKGEQHGEHTIMKKVFSPAREYHVLKNMHSRAGENTVF